MKREANPPMSPRKRQADERLTRLLSGAEPCAGLGCSSPTDLLLTHPRGTSPIYFSATVTAARQYVCDLSAQVYNGGRHKASLERQAYGLQHRTPPDMKRPL